MEMKKINSGRLRAIGYDSRARMLQVQLDDGSTLHTAASARMPGGASAGPAQHGVSIATTSRKSLPRSAFPPAHPRAKIRLTNYSKNPESETGRRHHVP
ncbi:MAG: hypothetical protein WBQ69_03610 [Gallionella sp.]